MKLSLSEWTVVGAVGLVLFAVAAITRPSFLGFTFDPFGLNARALKIAQAEAAHAQLDTSARSLEVEGMTAQAQRLDTYSHVVITTQAMAAEATAEARSAPDANEPLEAERAARLRRVDSGLCDARPTLAGCPSPAGASGGGD